MPWITVQRRTGLFHYVLSVVTRSDTDDQTRNSAAMTAAAGIIIPDQGRERLSAGRS